MRTPARNHMTGSKRNGRRSGFSLLEMILALAIFVGSIAALSRLVVLGLDNADYARWQLEASLIAENRFAELEAGILTISNSGGSDPDFPEWEWSLTAESADLAGLYLLSVEVRNTQRPSVRDFTFRLSRFWLEESDLEE